MMTHRYLETLGCHAELIPVPRRLSASCGTAVKATTGHKIFEVFISSYQKDSLLNGIEVEGLYNDLS